jgi:hypothetical protein
MSKPEGESKFEQMRSRRHMLNNLGPKPASKRDSNLIGGISKPVKAKQIEKNESNGNREVAKQPSTLAKNAGKVMGLEIDKFKEWTGLKRDCIKDSIVKKHTTPQANTKSFLSSGLAFNNDRNAIGNTNLTPLSGIIRKQDRDPMNVRDIDGASSKVKSYIINKIFHKKSNIDDFMQSKSLMNNGMRYDYSDAGGERTFDTKRFMRVDDIEGAKPKVKNTITDYEKKLILSNDLDMEKIYHNSHYFRKQRERQGKLPFTRRIGKAAEVTNNSFVSTIDPYTGEDFHNAYVNRSTERPNERMKRNLQRIQDEEDIENIKPLQDLRAQRVASKRSHKLGLNKDYSPEER